MAELFIPIRYLNQIKTISAQKVLISFLTKQSELGNGFAYPLKEIMLDLDMSIGCVRDSISELMELKFIESVARRGNDKKKYNILIDCNLPKLNVVVESPNSGEYKRATGAKVKPEVQKSEIEKEIIAIDFNSMNLFSEDINSQMIVNSNLYMDIDELGSLAHRVLIDVFEPRAGGGEKKKSWFGIQNNLMKDLLVKWRTEQVVAAILYWTEISPPRNGITSLRFLMWSQKNRKGVVTSNMMIALDHYKAFYINNEHEFKKDEIEQNRIEALRKKRDEEERLKQEAESVAAMSNEDFVAQMLASYGKKKDG